MLVKGEWEIERVPHSIYIRPLHLGYIWPPNPNTVAKSLFGKLDNDGEFNTFDDWRLVPTSRPLVAPPPFKENYLDLPATYGSLDYSRAHTGLPVYGNRTGSWEFVVLNDFRPWEIAYSDILHTIHGKKCMITLDDDLDYFYVGNLTLSEWRSDPGWSRIVINYNLEPYKYLKNVEHIEVNLDANVEQSLVFYSSKLGQKAEFPWVSVVPSSGTGYSDPIVIITFDNNELIGTSHVSLSETGKYVQVPEILFSNETGKNEISLELISDKPADVYIEYYRGYM